MRSNLQEPICGVLPLVMYKQDMLTRAGNGSGWLWDLGLGLEHMELSFSLYNFPILKNHECILLTY